MARDQSVIIAYHEAGHAVMAMANGFNVVRMSNLSGPNGMGYVHWQAPDPPTDLPRISTMLTLASGMSADFIHWDLTGEANEASQGHRNDREQAEVYLRELRHAGLFDIYATAAARFLRRGDVWEWVEGFAEVMIMAGTIDGREIIHRARRKYQSSEKMIECTSGLP